MADRKISELSSQFNSNLASGDLVHIVDISESANVDKNKSITIGELDKRYYSPKDITTFTPSLNAGTATFSGESGLYYRNQNWMIIRGYAGVTGGGSSDLTMTIPDSLTIDTTYILNTSAISANDCLGYGKWFDSGSAYRDLNAVYFSTTQVKFFSAGVSALVGSALANNDQLNWHIEVPILEWA